MRGSRLLRFLAVFFAIAVIISYPLKAVDGRDFTAAYRCDNQAEDGGQVSLTLTLVLTNYSGSDVSGATVVLENPTDLANPYASFGSVAVAAEDSTRLSGTITIPADEYARWQKDGSPTLHIQWSVGDGDTVIKPVELVALPVAEVQQ
jgi:hypothetical protein